MHKTKRIKMMAGVLCLSLFGLAVDRMSQGPADAEASESSVAAAVQVTVSTPETKTPAVPAVPHRPVSELLSRYANELPADMSTIADAFSPSPGWVTPTSASLTPIATEDTDAAKGRQFARTHSVTAVMTIGDGGFAIVNQQIVRLGDAISGFTLISVQRDRAVFRSGRAEVLLDVPVASQ